MELRITVWVLLAEAKNSRLLKNCKIGDFPSFTVSETNFALATEYKVSALTTWRGPSARRSRIAPGIVSMWCSYENGKWLTLSLEVDEDWNPSDLLLALCEFCENDEASETSSPSHTLQLKCKWIEIVVGNWTTANDSYSTKPFEDEDGEWEDDTDCEDPFWHGKWNGRFDLTGPFVEAE